MLLTCCVATAAWAQNPGSISSNDVSSLENANTLKVENDPCEVERPV